MSTKQLCPYREWGVHDGGVEYSCKGGALNGFVCEDMWADNYICKAAQDLQSLLDNIYSRKHLDNEAVDLACIRRLEELAQSKGDDGGTAVALLDVIKNHIVY